MAIITNNEYHDDVINRITNAVRNSQSVTINTYEVGRVKELITVKTIVEIEGYYSQPDKPESKPNPVKGFQTGD